MKSKTKYAYKNKIYSASACMLLHALKLSFFPSKGLDP